jgi:GAF domain-containing protein
MRSALQSGEIEQTIDADTESGVLAVPLHVRGLRLGVLRLRKPPESGPWTDEEIAVIKVLTEQIGPTLDSARLFEAAQQQAARERLVGQISSQMRAVPIVDAVLETAVREIGESLGLHDVTVKLESDDGTA